jgi:hypothetical protein
MQRTFQTLCAFWAALALVLLIFSTMVEGTRTYIEHQTIVSYLVRWFVIIAPAPVFYFLAERQKS